jgi:hypothetical protein
MTQSVPISDLACFIIVMVACSCFLLCVLSALAFAIWSPERFEQVAGRAKVGFFGFTAICGYVMIKYLSVAANLKQGIK